MNRWELLLLALVLWTALGVAGTVLSLVRRERAKALRGAVWLVGIWVIYLAAELTVAKLQQQRVVAVGQRACFDEMCFVITRAEEVPSYFGRNIASDGTRLLKISILVENRSRERSQSESLIHAYLLDGDRHPWAELPGLGGIPLTARVAPGGTVLSQPVFKVPADAQPLGLVLTHGHGPPGLLVIGDSDSLGHQPDILALPNNL